MDMKWVRPSGVENDPIITTSGLIKVRRLVHTGTARQVCGFAFILLTGEGKFRVRVGTYGEWDAERKYRTVGEFDTLPEAEAVGLAEYRLQ